MDDRHLIGMKNGMRCKIIVFWEVERFLVGKFVKIEIKFGFNFRNI